MTANNDNEIILYDLARRDDINESWSFNVWKTRLILNYKFDLRAPGNTTQHLGWLKYTVPTIRLPDGTFVRDSAVIAETLETLFPSPKLIFDPATQAKAEHAITASAMPLSAIFIPRIARDVLIETSVPLWRAAREKTFGMTFEELEVARGGKKAWKAAAEPGFRLLHAVLTEHKWTDGPFVMGREVSYGDLMIVALIESLKRIGENLRRLAVLGHAFECKDPLFLWLSDSCQD
ncbi:hypothetical protein LTR08_007888 [Meristemomyces frigidus]|nr:hypothetical protein LTR08_007888 [Meristemomyces frigidus]